MIIDQKTILPDGRIVTKQVVVADNYLDPPVDPEPTLEEDRDQMLVDLDYRLTLLELGVND